MSAEVSYSLEKLALEIGATLQGDGSVRISGIAPLDAAKAGDITFVTNSRYVKMALGTHASAILCAKPIPGVRTAFLLSPNPYASLAKVISLFHPPMLPLPGIRKGAFVDPKASVDSRASVADGAFVSAGAKIGARSVLYPGVFIGENTVIGEDCLLHPNVTVRENCLLGNRVILQPGVVVGSDGFGFAPEGQSYKKIPQVGNVVIEDDVELGANTCVDRAVLGSTYIGKGAKLDNLIQVGHNVIIGDHTVMAALSGISGSTQVGSHVMMGGQVGIAGHLKIGDDVTLATRTGVMEDIPQKGLYWGSPSTDMATEMKNVAAYRQLPGLLKRVRHLERALGKLGGAKKNEK
ncbi:MAG TPA: UDP-3-O-(3-hydroxymyristoyl)glucosamine N-acyltransferase [bacterium]|nr:UDP-3-O-(3-hydroxymyristoyl)glucosamine N-acyltransferase [bacterium]